MKKIITLLICAVIATVFGLSYMPEYTLTTTTADANTAENTEIKKTQFEQAVEIIKKYEGLHQPKHYPFVGYGHLVLKGENFSRTKALSQSQAENLLRNDLKKLCAQFRDFGKDSLLLGVLAYNIGPGNVKKSTVYSKLKNGDRNIETNYLAHCKYKGKQLSQLKRRRVEEFETLFIKEHDSLAYYSSNNLASLY